MTRKFMLKKLSTVNVRLFFSDNDWKDIGYTEREIWVNSKGYGYVSFDEPLNYWIVSGIDKLTWNKIRNIIKDGTILIEDIQDTPFMELLEDMDLCEVELSDILYGILDLPEEKPDKIYCMDTFDGLVFFKTKRDFKKSFERKWCDVQWNELDEYLLECWINRLFKENK